MVSAKKLVSMAQNQSAFPISPTAAA